MPPIISIKAGRAHRRSPNENWVEPQPTRGRIEIEVGEGLLTFSWKPRDSSSTTEEDDLIIFPGDCTFTKVPQDPTGRTHVLKFSSSDSRDFFWFQDPSTSKDVTNAFNINSLLQDAEFVPVENHVEPAPAASSSNPSTLPPQTPAHPQTSSSTIPTIPGAPKANRIADISSSIGQPPASSSSSTSRSGTGTGVGAGSGSGAAGATFNEDQVRALARLLGGGGAGLGGAGGEVQEDAHLTDILTPQNLTPLLLSSPHPSTLLHSLIPHIPSSLPLSSPPTASEITQILNTPQWSEAVAGLDAALRTGGADGGQGLGPMMRELGLGERAGRGVGEFLEEVGKLGKKEREEEGEDEDRMDTD